MSSVEDFVQLELLDKDTGRPDRDLSVFDIDDSVPTVVRVRAEYNSSFRSPPGEEETVSFHSSLEDLQVNQSPGGTRFAFTKEQHRTLFFTDDDEVRAAAASVFEQWSNRVRVATADAIKSYARERLESGDPEWVALCSDKKKKKWKAWALPNPELATPPSGAIAPPGAIAPDENNQHPPPCAEQPPKKTDGGPGSPSMPGGSPDAEGTVDPASDATPPP